MKKIIGLITVLFIICSTLAYAGGDKNRGDEGQGSTGTTGQGSVSQNRGG